MADISYRKNEPSGATTELWSMPIMTSRLETSWLTGDQTLIARLRNGDDSAFESLVQTYGGPLIAHAFRIVGDADVGREVVQDVFLSVWLQRDRLQPEWDIRAYLYGLTKQRSIDAIRTERSSSERERRWITQHLAEFDGSDMPGDDPEEGEVRRAVWNALLELTPRCREVFLLVMDHKMAYPEIARSLGLSETTVRRHMSRAVAHLAEIFGPGVRFGD